MLESKFTTEILTALRELMPSAVVFKHNDQFTGGIPDFSVTIRSRTTWFEVKLCPRLCTPLQWLTLIRLKRAWLVIYDQRERTGLIIPSVGTLPDITSLRDYTRDVTLSKKELVAQIVTLSLAV